MATICQFDITKMEEVDVLTEGARHLLSQGRKSETGDGACVYKGEGGLCCAAAPFMQYYRVSMENNTWARLVGNCFQPAAHTFLISQLQNIHDEQEVDSWEICLRKLFVRMNCPVSIIDNILDSLDKKSLYGDTSFA